MQCSGLARLFFFLQVPFFCFSWSSPPPAWWLQVVLFYRERREHLDNQKIAICLAEQLFGKARTHQKLLLREPPRVQFGFQEMCIRKCDMWPVIWDRAWSSSAKEFNKYQPIKKVCTEAPGWLRWQWLRDVIWDVKFEVVTFQKDPWVWLMDNKQPISENC